MIQNIKPTESGHADVNVLDAEFPNEFLPLDRKEICETRVRYGLRCFVQERLSPSFGRAAA